MAFGCQWPKFAFWLIFWWNPVVELSLHAIIDNEKQKCNGSYMKLQWKKGIYYKDLLIIFLNCKWCFEQAYWFLQVVSKQKRLILSCNLRENSVGSLVCGNIFHCSILVMKLRATEAGCRNICSAEEMIPGSDRIKLNFKN